MAKAKFELIVTIVNQGFADSVMDAARACGAKGGTILNARGTARQEAENKFDILIHPEKEIVLILARTDIKDAILHAIYKEVGLDTPGQGIAFYDYDKVLAEFEVSGWVASDNNISVTVTEKSGDVFTITFPKKGTAPMIIAVDPTQKWMNERVSVPSSWFYIE